MRWLEIQESDMCPHHTPLYDEEHWLASKVAILGISPQVEFRVVFMLGILLVTYHFRDMFCIMFRS